MTSLKRFSTKIDSLLKSVVNISAAISSTTIFVMMFIITTDVILRYIFNRPVQGTYELAQFMVVGVVFLSIAYIQSVRGHIKMEIATSWLPLKGQTALDIFSHLLGIFFFIIILWQSGQLAWKAWVTQDHTMGLVAFPLWPAKSLVPLGSFLICLQLFSDVIRDIALLSNRPSEGSGDERKG